METGYIISSMATELTVKVPWGHISGKIWGSLSSPPILCVHGIQDNANTFDNLIPLLPSSFCYVCIDLPGHGRSSHFPQGIFYSLLDYVMTITRVVEHFQWKNFIYMGHSLGGQMGCIYSGFYPQRVSKLIVLDSIVPYFRDNFAENVPKYYDSLHELEKKTASKSAPSYSEEEALRRLTDGRPSTLTKEAARTLLARGVTRSGDGYAFSADQRLKLRIPLFFPQDVVATILSKIQCPTFLLRASETEDAGSWIISGRFETQLRDSLGEKYYYKVAKGSHDVHLNNPERFAEELTKFLIKQQSSL